MRAEGAIGGRPTEGPVLLQARGIDKAWGSRPVLIDVDLTVQPGEVIGLVGPNGCGKSTLLSILAGHGDADGGEVIRRAAVGFLGQEPVLPPGTVGEAADAALAWHRALLHDWQAALDAGDVDTAGALQGRLDLVGWDLSHTVDAVLDRVQAPPRDADVGPLSGGERRRVALAHALLSSPDLLLLDEPTNHLDAEAVGWLEAFLDGFEGGVVLVTHDRYLLEAVATRIVELEPGEAVSYDGSYGDYLVARAERISALHAADAARRNLLRREAAWAARSPAARSTKQKARLDRLDALKSSDPLPSDDGFSLDLRTGARLGHTVLEIRGLRKAFGDRPIVRDLDLDILPGDRLGIVGPNGAGKSTLLSLLAGTLSPDAGTIRRAPRVRAALLDQHRTGLDDDATLFENAGQGNDTVDLGDRTIHVAGFLKKFLFERDQFDQPVSVLSGGERARLLLARRMLDGAQLLLLDEPTNDLDLSTLRVLEEALLAFDGAVVTVTHDRAFLDRVCTGVLAFHGEGEVVRYADRGQWLAARASRRADAAAVQAQAAVAPSPPPKPAGGTKAQRLSYKEQRELEALPARIEQLETEQATLEATLGDPATYQRDDLDPKALVARLEAVEVEVLEAYGRWEALEGRG